MQKIIKNKGQLGGLATNVLIIGASAIILVMLLVILQDTRDLDILTKVNSATVTNESYTPTTAGAALTANTAPACSAALSMVTNSSGDDINSGNYTLNRCTLANTTSTFQTSWNVTYDYTFGDIAYTSANSTVVGLATFGDFWSIIVLAIVAAIVLGIIFAIFRKGGQR